MAACSHQYPTQSEAPGGSIFVPPLSRVKRAPKATEMTWQPEPPGLGKS
jgi:hypothetical protein